MTLALEMQTLDLRFEGPVGILTLDRPRSRNAIDGLMREELRTALDALAADATVRGLVLTGSGPAFCSGGDIRGMQERLDQGAQAGELGWRRQREFHETLTTLFHLDKPTVAAVNGAAMGLGLDLALTCDFVYAADSAVVGATFVRRGLVPDGGGMFHLPRRVGLARAKELVFSGRTLDAAEALEIGLVDRVFPAEKLVAASVEFLAGLAVHPPMAQGLAKEVLNRSLELGYEQVNVLGSQAQAVCYGSPAHQESVRTFLAERAAAKSRREGS